MDYAAEYGKMHDNDKRFPGYSLSAYTEDMKELVDYHKPESLLDYGSGKGFQYLIRRVHESWGGLLPYCYDIGVRQLANKPDRTFDGVICSDVMEHIERADVQGVLAELISYADSFLFLGISCRPTKKKLSDGRDVHVTIEPPEWWILQIEAALVKAGKGPGKGEGTIEVRACWDIDGHFDCDETPYDSRNK